MINVGIVFGGKSVEHDVSIITYMQVKEALDIKKYLVFPVYLNKDNVFMTSKKVDNIEVFKNNDFKSFKECYFKRKNNKVYLNNKVLDVVIILVHGKDLEDGTIVSFFKILNIPTTVPRITVSAMLHNKYLSKLFLKDLNINTIESVRVCENKWESNEVEVLKELNKFKKVIIKPTNLGSSVGVKIVSGNEEIKKTINNAFCYDDEVIIERCLTEYLEFNQAIYRYKGEYILSRIEEIKNSSSLYTFEKKYENGNITRVVPAKISNSLKNRINKTTQKIMINSNTNGVIRVDYLFDIKEQILYVNEINVIPGALSYYLFESRGIYFSKLLDDLINEAILEHDRNERKISSYSSNIFNSDRNNKK